jgi:SAM-dependent methyltransferase
VLVDFADSVLVESQLSERAGGSTVERNRGGGPGAVLRRLTSPVNRVAERHARDLIARLESDRLATGSSTPARLLIVGGGTRGSGAGPLETGAKIEIVNFDIYASELTDFIADAHRIPLADASIQAVWIQAVLEHVLEPARVVAEIERVLSPGGYVYAETPFLQHVHEGPWDFTRFTESGHRWLFRGFERLGSGPVAGPATVWVWATEQLVRGLTRSVAAGKFARLAFSWLHAFDRLIPRAHAIDGASCVYFYGRRSGVPIGPHEAVGAYAGAQCPDAGTGRDD